MKIVRLLWKNLRRGVMTIRFPERPPAADNFRGLVQFDPTRCTGCAMCRFRCTAGAITFVAAGRSFTWGYNGAQCTFCGRCVEGCKDHALTQESCSPPVYTTAGSLVRSYTLERKTPPAHSPAAGMGTPQAGGAS